jgi:hypothetical protein
MRPLLRYSPGREAYVLRLVGGQTGPVLRPDRRREELEFDGTERRGFGPAELIAADSWLDATDSWLDPTDGWPV